MISVVQSSVENQDPVEEDLIEKSTAESESFLRSFVRRLPSERQPSEIFEEEAVIEEILPAISTSQVESPVRIEETAVEEKQTSEIELVQEKQEDEAVEEVTQSEIESEPSPEIECVQEQSATQEEEISVSYNNEPLKSEPVQELIKSEEEESSLQDNEKLEAEVESSVLEEECQLSIEETIQKEIVSSEVESAPEKSVPQEEETIQLEETEPAQESITLKEEESREPVDEITETPSAESVQQPEEEDKCQYEIEETIEEIAKSEEESVPQLAEKEESVSQIEETVEEESTQESECVKEQPILEEIIMESASTVEGVPVEEETSQLQVEETVQEVESTPEAAVVLEQELCEPTQEESCVSQIEETVNEQPAQESECVKEESIPQENEISQPCIEETSEPEPVLSNSEETQMEFEETVQKAAASEVESTTEAVSVPEEEICEPCNNEKTQQSEEEFVQHQVQEEECQLPVEKTIEEDPVQESIKVEENLIPTEEPAHGKQEDESLTQSEGTLEEAQETEITQELTNSEEGESSLMDGETIEEILESEIESCNDLTVAEDEHTNIEDITEDTLEIETECVSQITDETAEEIPNKVKDVSVVEEIPETQIESVQPASDEVIAEEILPKVEELVIQTPCSKLKMEESGLKSSRQGSEERKMTVNVCAMELTACMEDCGKMPTDLLPKITDKPHGVKHEASDKIPSVFLDTTIPHDSHLVVSEAECSAEVVPPEDLDLDENEYESSPVVLSGKMTLSVIGMELNAETPEIQEEPLYTVEEPDAPPRVRFSEPTDRVFLIPVDPEEELLADDTGVHDEFRTEEDDEQLENPVVTYRPPTPPLQHLVDHEDAEFLTYDQLEEAGEVDSSTEEIEHQEEVRVALTPVPESLAEQSQEEVDKETVLPVGIDQSLMDALESQIISAEEKIALTENKNQGTELADHVENVEVIPAVDEHASIGQMVQQIRVAMEESAPKFVEDSLKVEETKEETVESSEVVSLDKEMTIEEHSTNVPDEESPSVQNALNKMVDSIITESIVDSVAESLRRDVIDCDLSDVTTSLEQPEQVIHLLSERINDLPQVEKTVMDVLHQIVSDSTSNAETEDFERNREEEVMEHALEQIEIPVSSSPVKEQQPEVVNTVEESVSHTEIESEPSISGFTIREDFPDDEDTQPMTEEEILQARQEIEEIKKLLADVSSGVVHHSASEVPKGSSNIVTELAYVRQMLQRQKQCEKHGIHQRCVKN